MTGSNLRLVVKPPQPSAHHGFTGGKDQGVAAKSESNSAFVTPVPIDISNIEAIDKEIWQVLSNDKVITPDDVRGRFTSLEEAILTDGWPTLAESRGKTCLPLITPGRSKMPTWRMLPTWKVVLCL